MQVGFSRDPQIQHFPYFLTFLVLICSAYKEKTSRLWVYVNGMTLASLWDNSEITGKVWTGAAYIISASSGFYIPVWCEQNPFPHRPLPFAHCQYSLYSFFKQVC